MPIHDISTMSIIGIAISGKVAGLPTRHPFPWFTRPLVRKRKRRERNVARHSSHRLIESLGQTKKGPLLIRVDFPDDRFLFYSGRHVSTRRRHSLVFLWLLPAGMQFYFEPVVWCPCQRCL